MNNKITKISSQKHKGRFNVFVNDRYSFSVGEEVLIKYQLFKGNSIDKDLINKIRNTDNYYNFYHKALDFLSYKIRTEEEVYEKLKTQSFYSQNDNETVNDVINNLKKDGIVNDVVYAENYVRTMVKEKNKGPVIIERNLIRKGIKSKIIIMNAISKYYPHNNVIENGIYQSKRLLKRYKKFAAKQRKVKLKNILIQKGYSYENIMEIIENIKIEVDPLNQKQLLRKEGGKIWNKNKHLNINEKKKKLKLKQSLYRKGFEISEIDNFFNDFFNK